MLILKYYETAINFTVADMFRGIEYDEILLEKIKQYYEGKCESNTYITQIKSIERKSQVSINKGCLKGDGVINVQFSAYAIVYNVGDILPMCRIDKLDKSARYIFCWYEDYVLIKVKISTLLKNFTPGQYVNIIIEGIEYHKSEKMITVVGSVFAYNVNIEIIELDYDDNENKELVNKKLESIKELIIPTSSSYKFFKDIYYGFTERIPLKSTSVLDILDNINKSKPKLDYIVRHPMIDKDSMHVLTYAKEQLNNEANKPLFVYEKFGQVITRKNIYLVIYEVLNEYYNYVNMLIETDKKLNTQALISEHDNIWNLYRNKVKMVPPKV